MRLNFLLQRSLPLLPVPGLNNPLLLQLKNLISQQIVINLRHGHAGEFAFGALLMNGEYDLWQVLDFG